MRYSDSSHYKERDRDRELDRDRDREKDRARDRDYHRDRDHSRRYRSKSPSRSRSSRDKPKKSKKSKKSKKYYRRSKSSDSSSSSSISRSSSHDSRSSRGSRVSKKSSSRARSTRPPSSESNSRTAMSLSVSKGIKEIDLLDIQVQKALDTIEEDAFLPKTFFSTRDREAPPKPQTSEKVLINLKDNTVTVPKPQEHSSELNVKDEIFHPNFIGDPELKAEKWIRKLYNYRQKY